MTNDVQQIRKLMNEYAWSLDFCEWDRLGQCFCEPMEFHSSTMESYYDFPSLRAALQYRTPLFNLRRHMISNAFIRVDGDKGYFYANLMNSREVTGPKPDELFLAGGYYRNQLFRTENGWKIAVKCWQDVWTEGGLPAEMISGTRKFSPVMDSIAAGSTFGVPDEQASDLTSNNRQQVCDLVMRLYRTADANDKEGVATLLGDADQVELSGDTYSELTESVDRLCSGGAARLTYLTNELVAVGDDRADFVSYLYQVSGGSAGEDNHHSGGFLAVSLRCAEGTWQVRSLRYRNIWTKGEPLGDDPRQGLELADAFLSPFRSAAPCGSDEEQIAELHNKYTWCFDTGDFSLMASCFTDDVQCDFKSGMGKRSDRRAMIAQLAKDRNLKPFYQHYTFNTLVNIDEEQGKLYVYAFTRRTPDGGGDVLCAGGRYSAKAVKHDGKWAFSRFVYERDYGPYK